MFKQSDDGFRRPNVAVLLLGQQMILHSCCFTMT
jgi:hypothetical protein